jgi:lipopolysaccharide/colanic/teichoic acid biosynthesis glycosyltransferase
MAPSSQTASTVVPKRPRESGAYLQPKFEPQLSEEVRKKMAFSKHCQHKPTPVWKRSTDIVVAIGLLVVFSPLLLFIAAFIRITSGGPVLFKQRRLGEMGDEFVILKFRTLRHCSRATDEHRQFISNLAVRGGAVVKPDFSDRLIAGGSFLRKTSMDELPQLFNIIRGQMSLIGPRPDVLMWEDYAPEQLRRFEVLPGVTGLWQVSGKNRLTFQEMMEKDLEYVNKRSFWLDLSIALRTVGMLLKLDNC